VPQNHFPEVEQWCKDGIRIILATGKACCKIIENVNTVNVASGLILVHSKFIFQSMDALYSMA